MKCPICGKELELRNKQIGTNENGDPIFNEYAICRDCKKQWNLDKQRAKRTAAKKTSQTSAAKKTPSAKEGSPTREVTVKPSDIKQTAPVKKAAPKKEMTAKKPVSDQTEPVKKTAPKKVKPVKKSLPEEEEREKKPAPKHRPKSEEPASVPVKKAVKKRKPANSESSEEKRYSNIPPEKVRSKHEKAARKSYEDMVSADSSGKKAVKKKKKALEDETGEIRKASPVKPSPEKRNENVKSSSKKYEPETEEYDDDDYYDDDPRFRPIRIILGIISLAGFGYFIYKGFVTGLADTTEGGSASFGTTFIILALCMLVSALLYFIMQKKNTIFAFLLPMVFYLGGSIFAFLQRGEDLQMLIAAIACAVLAAISLILAVTSRVGGYDDEEEDYDDAFEDDYADDDYDD